MCRSHYTHNTSTEQRARVLHTTSSSYKSPPSGNKSAAKSAVKGATRRKAEYSCSLTDVSQTMWVDPGLPTRALLTQWDVVQSRHKGMPHQCWHINTLTVSQPQCQRLRFFQISIPGKMTCWICPCSCFLQNDNCFAAQIQTPEGHAQVQVQWRQEEKEEVEKEEVEKGWRRD